MHPKAVYMKRKLQRDSSSGKREPASQVLECGFCLGHRSKGGLFTKTKASGFHHWSDSGPHTLSHRKFFPPSRAKPDCRECSVYILPLARCADLRPTEHRPLICKIPSSEGELEGGLQRPPQSVRRRLAQGSPPGADGSPLRRWSVLAGLLLPGSSPQSRTLAMKMPASMMALMCLSQPEFSRPHRKSLMEGDFSSHTAR